MRAGLCAALLCAVAANVAANVLTAKDFFGDPAGNRKASPVYFFDAAASSDCSACRKEFTEREAGADHTLFVVFMEGEAEFLEQQTQSFSDPNALGFTTGAFLSHSQDLTTATACNKDNKTKLPSLPNKNDNVEQPPEFDDAIADDSFLCGTKGTVATTYDYLRKWDHTNICIPLLPVDRAVLEANYTNASKTPYLDYVDGKSEAGTIPSTPVMIKINVSNPDHQGIYRSNRYFSDSSGEKTVQDAACHHGAFFAVVGGEGKADDKKDLSTAAIAAIGTGAAVVAAAIGYVIYTRMGSGAGVFASSLQ